MPPYLRDNVRRRLASRVRRIRRSIARINREQYHLFQTTTMYIPNSGKSERETGTRAKKQTPIIYPRKKQIKFQTAATSATGNGQGATGNGNGGEGEGENEGGRHLCALSPVPCFALSFARAHVLAPKSDAERYRAAWSAYRVHARLRYAPLRYQFEFDRRNRRARHELIVESRSRKFWGIRDLAVSIGEDAAQRTSAQHRDRDRREICRSYVIARLHHVEHLSDIDARGCDKDFELELFSCPSSRECADLADRKRR